MTQQLPSSVKPAPPSVQNYSLPSVSLTGGELRLDAARYSPDLLDAIRVLRESGMQLARLADITDDVFIPPRFKRIYVEPEYGVPFLQGSHIVHFQPATLKYLSRLTRRLEQWIVNAGWILVTCSGTIGRTAICPTEWDGWAASQHILRIVPDEERCPSGYLCSFLSSPLGQVQLTANIYGAVVDELTEKQADGILVPLPTTEKDRALVRAVDAAMRGSVAKRSEAVSLVNKAVAEVRPSPVTLDESGGFSLWIRHLGDDELRIDAGYYNPSFLHALDLLGETDAVRLGEIAEVFMPPRFKRIYVEPEHGVPFLQGSHVIHFQAAGLKHLYREHDRIGEVLVKAGWILVTRSGTVGRVAMCPVEWEGWAATEDIIRVVPDEKECPGGYLLSFLASLMGQVQLTSQVHGAVVDHLTEDHIRNVLVPLPDARTIRKIDSTMKKGIDMKSKAVASAQESVGKLMQMFETEKRATRTGYKADYLEATPEQVAKAMLMYRPSKR